MTSMERPTCHSRRQHGDEVALIFRVVVSGVSRTLICLAEMAGRGTPCQGRGKVKSELLWAGKDMHIETRTAKNSYAQL